MTRLLVRIEPNMRGPNSVSLEEALSIIPGARVRQNLVVKPTTPALRRLARGELQPNVVREVGKCLIGKLRAHPAVKQALAQALGSASPIYVQLDAPDAEQLPWETLFDAESGFLALDARWPVGRVIDSTVAGARGDRLFEPPLRVLAVLAAAGVDAKPEWQALHGAAEQARLVGFDVVMRALVAQHPLQAELAALPGVSVGTVTNASDLFREIKDFQPQILHFFCHGITEGGPQLLLATPASWLVGAPTGGLSISPDQLNAELPNFGSEVWLVVLNCCEGAAASRDAVSLASSLVAAGFPAAIGMREVVRDVDAYVFTGRFYRAAFEEVDRAAREWRVRPAVEWVRALHAPRRELCDRYRQHRAPSAAAAELKEWTLPVLYTRPEPFRIRGPSTNVALSPADRRDLDDELRVVRQLRERFAKIAHQNPGVLAELDQRIHELLAQLYPQHVPA